MAQLAQDRILRKEVALGVVREIPPPENHIGLGLFPFLEVESDDVIFSYVMADTDGLAPARAEDSESELAMKDATVGTGRASIIDWAIKDHYDPSDISRYREFQQLAELAAGGGSMPLSFVGRMIDGFDTKVARDTARRRRKLDNRAEWLIMTALETGAIAYNDGKISFSVSYGRPAGQQDQAPTSGLWNLANAAASDPLGDLETVKETMYNTYSVNLTRAITSRRVLRSIMLSDKFRANTFWNGADPRYLTVNGGPLTVANSVAFIEQATGIQFTVYDAVYRTRALGSTTIVNNRFTNDDKVILLPDPADVAELSDTEMGFGRMLTSPHPEGNWTPGFYEWEKDTGPDPWGRDFGTGIKMFPVFPHLELSYVLDVL